MVKVKICGITNIEDARLAAELGADMLGFNFYDKSVRYISPQEALRVVGDLSEHVENHGVFVNMDSERINEHTDLLGLDGVQLHGDENDDFVSNLRQCTDAKIIKAFRVRPGFSVGTIKENPADSILLDAFAPGQYGGTGERFEWTIASDAVKLRPGLILAGGLTPDNVADAVRIVRPYAVDVASGVESAPGKKDPAKLEAFIKNAKLA